MRGDCSFGAVVLSLAPESLGAGARRRGSAGSRRGAAHLSGDSADPLQRARQFNLEFRVADATASPYLALAMLVQAGLDGVREQRRSTYRIHGPLPASLEAALTLLEETRRPRRNGWGADLLLAYSSSSGRRSKAWTIWMKMRSAAAMPNPTESPSLARARRAGRGCLEERRTGRSNFVIVVDHASRRIPRRLGDLGLPAAELQRHIAWDIGALGVARRLPRRWMRRWWRKIIRGW